jgi:hypothetical protein
LVPALERLLADRLEPVVVMRPVVVDNSTRMRLTAKGKGERLRGA